MAKVIVVDEQRCLGCKSCTIACAMAHCEAETLVEAINAETPPQSRVYVEPAEGTFGVPLQCRHCEDAPCVAICPTEAIYRASDDNPPVLMDRDRCIGCRMCMLVCPFGVISLSRDGKAMIKCDLCIERTEEGELPACVAACPTAALQFVELDDALRQKRREAAARVTAKPEKAQK
ncbi:MAG: 4Fe-4S dicluster domain-containing protein [Planctomycetota bacterium]|nr:4Fe-4S dicluster domain-containing protein [Planctomycetota bacterium]